MYYTPQTVIDYLDGSIIDPAAGTGGFLIDAVQRLHDPLVSNPPFGTKPTSQGQDSDAHPSMGDAGNDQQQGA